MARLAVLVAFTLVLLLSACAEPADGWQGYVEGEFVRVAPAAAGRLLVLDVERGGKVAQGDALYTLEQEREQAALSESADRIAAIDAQIQQARAQLALARTSHARAKELHAKGLVPQEQVDQAWTALAAATAKVRELDAQQQSARAQTDQAQWQLTQKAVAAPVSGLVEDTYYRVGEWVPAGAPVVSLLPPENRMVRFFVPEAAVGGVRVGQRVEATCDGCAAPIALAISYVSPQAEFTPPVIYSRQTREKLVFLVEARPAPADAVKLHPGQPVEVHPVD